MDHNPALARIDTNPSPHHPPSTAICLLAAHENAQREFHRRATLRACERIHLVARADRGLLSRQRGDARAALRALHPRCCGGGSSGDRGQLIRRYALPPSRPRDLAAVTLPPPPLALIHTLTFSPPHPHPGTVELYPYPIFPGVNGTEEEYARSLQLVFGEEHAPAIQAQVRVALILSLTLPLYPGPEGPEPTIATAKLTHFQARRFFTF